MLLSFQEPEISPFFCLYKKQSDKIFTFEIRKRVNSCYFAMVCPEQKRLYKNHKHFTDRVESPMHHYI